MFIIKIFRKYFIYILIFNCFSFSNVFCQEKEAPNIILIVADDLGYNDLASYGQDYFPTPNTDKLAKEGVKFTRAYSPSAICSPTRYAILTGTDPFRSYPNSHVLFNGEPLIIEEGQLTIASLLKEEGYHTGIIGKWHLGIGDSLPRNINNPGRGPNDVGFDYSYIIPDGPDMYPEYYIEDGEPQVPKGVTFDSKIEILDRVGYKLLQHDPVGQWDNFRPDDKIGRTLAKQAEKYIDENAGKPFFLYFPTAAIHRPLITDPQFEGKSGIGPYGDFVMEFDWVVGQVMKALDRHGIADNTLLIVTSDNGPYKITGNSNHQPSYPWRGRKATIWEGGTRVPFIARWPGKIPAGWITDEPISLVDMVATVAGLTNAKLPNKYALDSFNMLPALRSRKGKSIRPYLVTGTRGMEELAIHQGHWKYIWDFNNNIQLYNIENDTTEAHDVSTVYKKKANELKNLLMDYLESGSSRPDAKGSQKTIQFIYSEKEERNKMINQKFKNNQ